VNDPLCLRDTVSGAIGASVACHSHCLGKPSAVEPPLEVKSVDYSGGTPWRVVVTEVHMAKRRIKAVRAIRRSTELEGSRSTDATRADQLAYARGIITAAELRDRVRRRYNVQ